MKFLWALALLASVSACVSTSAPKAIAPVERPRAEGTVRTNGEGLSEADFIRIAARVELVAEELCVEVGGQASCDFLIVMDDRVNQPSNAYQFISRDRQPVLAVTIPLLNEVQNDDELAFVIGHEAAHHVAGHLDQQSVSAQQGAILGGFTAAILGADAEAIEAARDIGAFMGTRQFSKQHEIEADQIGAIIALNAGFNPERGVAYFTRIPDPGENFLGSHPSNSDRIEAVQSAVAGT